MVREKEIEGAPGYFILDDGTIRQLLGKLTKGNPSNGAGYFQYNLPCTYKKRGLRSVMVHRLVAKEWVHNPRPDIFNVVDHIDHNRGNNHFSNLRWLNHQLNCMNLSATRNCFL